MKLHEQIIEALKNTSSESPLTSSEVLSKLDEPTLDAYQNALDQLYNERRVNRCMVFKNGVESCLYWLTASGLKTTPYGMFQINPNKSIQAPRRDEIKPIQHETTTMQPDDKKQKSTAEIIRDTINANPGIPHEKLMLAIIGNQNDAVTVKKAEDMIIYTILKKDGFVRHNDTQLDGLKITKTYYSQAAYAKFIRLNKEALASDIPNFSQANLIKQTAKIQSKTQSQTTIVVNKPVQEVKTALDIQEGGDHYKSMAIQPVEYIIANNLGFIEGNIIKYISRYKNKNGVEDLKKARHFIDMLIEMQAVN